MFQRQNTGKHVRHKQLCLTIPPMLYVNLTNQMLSMIFKLTSLTSGKAVAWPWALDP